MNYNCSVQVDPGCPEELLEHYPQKAQDEVDEQDIVDYVFQVNADSIFNCLFCAHSFNSLSSKSKHMKVLHVLVVCSSVQFCLAPPYSQFKCIFSAKAFPNKKGKITDMNTCLARGLFYISTVLSYFH